MLSRTTAPSPTTTPSCSDDAATDAPGPTRSLVAERHIRAHLCVGGDLAARAHQHGR